MNQAMEMPVLRKAKEREKITLYFDAETVELYRVGKINKWDVAEIARKAVERAFKERREILLKPASAS